MKIYVIRHGETDANRANVIQGRLDIPLNDNGVKLARITGENLKGTTFDVCYSSPLIRARNTSEIVLSYSGNGKTPIIYDDRLKEFDGGTWEGKSIRLKDRQLPIVQVELFKWDPIFAGRLGNGETCKEVIKRTSDFLKELSKKNYKNVLVSTHGFATRAMLNMFYKNKLDFWQGNVPLNCAVNIIEVKDGKMKLVEKDKLYYDKSLAVDIFKKRKK